MRLAYMNDGVYQRLHINGNLYIYRYHSHVVSHQEVSSLLLTLAINNQHRFDLCDMS